MGYVRKARIYRLVFDEGDMAGFECRLRSTSFESIISSTGIQYDVEVLAEALVDWNLERADGTPVPVSLDSVRAQDPGFINAVMKAYSDAIFGVPGPLGESSSSGQPSPEASLPMEPLSPSQAS